jgi:hypothetical protein
MAQASISSFIDDTVTPAQQFNNGTNDSEASAASKTTMESRLSDSTNSITARVPALTGNYLKVKWFKNGKPFGTYKSRNYTLNKAVASLEYLRVNSAGLSANASLAITGTNTGTGAGTNQWTATVTKADSSTVDVTTAATWSSATPAAATVDANGLVTRVAAGSSVITATYGGVTNTRTMTVS